MANVLVRLDRPFVSTKDGRLQLKNGLVPGRVLSADNIVYLRSVRPEDGSYVMERGAPVTPGRYIFVENSKGEPFLAAEPDRDTGMMQEEFAKAYFGDWDAPAGEEANFSSTAVTRETEKDRIESLWGGPLYKDQNKLDKCDYSPIGPACMPHVTIIKLDGAGRPQKEITPWEHFGLAEQFPTFKPEKQKAKVRAY